MSEIIDLVWAGGPVAIVLIVLSIVAAALSLFKSWQFFTGGVGRHSGLGQALTVLSQGQRDVALRMLDGKTNPAARILQHAMQNAPAFANIIDTAREDVMRVAQEELRELRRYLRGIEVIAQSAPLLGLLGTVIGMIQAFSQLEAAGAAVDPSRLAGGIWTALLATALGLAIAIVFSIVGAWLEGRVENERSVIETTLSGYFAQAARIES